jgi:hypothetical protein
MSKRAPHSIAGRYPGPWLIAAVAFFLSLVQGVPWVYGQAQPATPGFQSFAGGRDAVRALLDPYGYVDEAKKWDYSRIDVCWESPQNEYVEQKALVRQSISGPDSSFERHSTLRFVGWDSCAPGTHGISIEIKDENPWSEVGPQQQGQARRRTRMLLNLDFVKWPCPIAVHCIVAIARHEFMHAVGVLHEHLRDDAPKQCKELYAGRPDYTGIDALRITAYDPDSIMNYCNNIYDSVRAPDLSPLDVTTIAYLYPPG